ncbi:MAG: hypothetical protein ACI87N_002950 [Flavobacteriales bacterium]|jgi:hypothetical protein
MLYIRMLPAIMKKLLNKIFSHKLTDRNWYHVIGWWEIRRFVFNAVLLLFGLISLLIFLFVLKFDANIIHPFTPIAFGLLANFFYTFGWVTELLIRLFSKSKATSFGIKSFKIGLVISIVLTFLPTIFFSFHWASTGEKFSSPYSSYTKIKPDLNQMTGTYYLDNKNSSTGISDTDKQKESKIILNSDSTFSMTNIPVYGFEQYQKYELWNGRGTWHLRLDNDTWKVTVDCDTLFSSDNKPTFKDGFFTNDFSIYNDKPPYKLYQIIGDPDEWTGALYEKKK